MKEEAEINLARVNTKNVKNQIDPLILASNKKQETLSENKIPELEEPESEPRIEHSEVVQPGQDSPVDYTSRGISHLKKEQIDDAISDFNKAIELNPGNAAVYISRGTAYYNQGQIDNAIYDKAIALNPKFAAAYNMRGVAHYKQGNRDKAISDYDKAIELNPEYAVAKKNRDLAYMNRSQMRSQMGFYMSDRSGVNGSLYPGGDAAMTALSNSMGPSPYGQK